MRQWMQRLIALFFVLAFILPAYPAADDIARLYNFTSGTTIQSSQVNGEFNQLITTMNNKFGRGVDNTLSGNNTFSGNSTFSGTATFSNATLGLKTDKLSEYTAGNGTLLNSVLLKNGFIQLTPTTQPYTPVGNGELGYDSTNNKYMVRVNGVNHYLIHDGNIPAVPSAAVKSDQTTATSNTVFVTPGTQQYHPSAAKAGFLYQGTGTPAILSSYGISAITRNGTGDYTITFSTAFASATGFWGSIMVGHGSATGGQVSVQGPFTTAPTTTTFRFATFNNSGVLQDFEYISGTFFGAQ